MNKSEWQANKADNYELDSFVPKKGGVNIWMQGKKNLSIACRFYFKKLVVVTKEQKT